MLAVELRGTDGSPMDSTRDEVLEVRDRVPLRLRGQRSVVQRRRSVLGDVRRAHMLLHDMRQDLQA